MSMLEATKPQSNEDRALRALARSGRRLVRRDGDWAVLDGGDRRRRPAVTLTLEEGARLVAEGRIIPADGAGYVLVECDGAEEARRAAPCPGPQAFAAAGRGLTSGAQGGPRRRGFIGLARRAEAGEGPLSLRAVQAGLRLIRDAEVSSRAPSVTMNWDAIPSDRGRRGPGGGGAPASARAAVRRLDRVRAWAGETWFQLAWAACVDGRSLNALARRLCIDPHAAPHQLARALEAVADAYDRV